MKIERLIGILSILLQKEKVTAKELAEKFEVSRRTIIRDIDSLCCAGIPIATAKGQGGGIAIMEGYKIDRTVLSSEEMKDILSGLRSLDSVSGTSRYRQLMEKLSADTSEMLDAGSRIIIDLSAWDKSAVSDKIELIKAAIDNSEKISFTYFAPGSEHHREIEPYYLIFQWSNWYVWGYCTMRKEFRMFKLTRLTDLKCIREKCENRDIPEYVCEKFRHTIGGIKAVVIFDRSLEWRIVDEFGPKMLQYDKKGDIILTFTWSDVPAFYQYILTYGDKAEIISPEEYRHEFSDLLKRISRRYEM